MENLFFILKDISFSVLFIASVTFIISSLLKIKIQNEPDFIWRFINPFIVAISGLTLLAVIENIFINLHLFKELIFVSCVYLAINIFILFHFTKFYRLQYRSTKFFILSIFLTVLVSITAYFNIYIAGLVIRIFNILIILCISLIFVYFNRGSNRFLLFITVILMAFQELSIILLKYDFIRINCIALIAVGYMAISIPILIMDYRNIKGIIGARKKNN